MTLAIARRIKDRIDRGPGMRAVLTRDGDYFIGLAQRVQKARRVEADLFVSVHADAFVQPHARGSSVFALSERGATSAAARWLAKRENESDLIGGVNLDVKDPVLARTLLDLSQTATINDSLRLAKAVLGELGDVNHLHKASVEQAGFVASGRFAPFESGFNMRPGGLWCCRILLEESGLHGARGNERRGEVG